MGKRVDGLVELDKPVAEPPERLGPERAPGGGGGPPDPPNWLDDPELSFWEKVGRFDEMWEDHAKRWPASPEKPGADHSRPDDPAGCWRGEGGRFLSPQDNAEADKQIAALRQPEKAATAILLDIQQDNSHGGHLDGLDHRFKGTTRLKEKIADSLENEVDSSLAEAVGEISDAIRYTFSFDSSQYTGGYGEVRQRLESAGYTMIYSKNHWLEDPQYKGINTRWETPDGGRFELQFHTSESFHAKQQLTHRSYERLRLPTTTRLEQRELKSYQSSVCAAIPKPAAVADIPTMRKTPDE